MSGLTNALALLTAVPLPPTMGGTGNAAAGSELSRIGAVGYGAPQTLTTAQQLQAIANLNLSVLPTTLPATSGQPWNNGGLPSIS